MRPIRMYSTGWCPDCHRAKALLKDRGVEFEEIDIDNDHEAAQTVMAANQGKRRVPTLVIGDEVHGNPPLSRLNEILDQLEQR